MITVRSARDLDDIRVYAAIQDEAWGDHQIASFEMLASRFALFPQGVLVAEDEMGTVVGFASTLKISSYDYASSPTWYELTSSGWAYNHLPNGKILYGIDLSVARGAPKDTMHVLMIGVGALTIREGCKYAMLGGRMPSYHKNAHRYPCAATYMQAKRSTGKYVDPEIQMYSEAPFLKIIQLLPNYFKDAASRDFGVLLRWRNPFYWGVPLPGRHFLANQFGPLYRLEQRYQKWKARRAFQRSRDLKACKQPSEDRAA